MPHIEGYPETAGPGDVFRRYPHIYRHWLPMGEAIMNGENPLSPGEREMIAAYVSGLNSCDYCHDSHAPVAVERGIAPDLLAALLEDADTAPVEDRFKPLLAFAKKLTLTPARITQTDVDAVFDAGWDEHAFQAAVAVVCRFAYMNRLVMAFGFNPPAPETAKSNAKRRVESGYTGYYPDMKPAE